MTMVGSAAIAMEDPDALPETDPAPQTRTVAVMPSDRIELTTEASGLSEELADALAVRAELEAVEPAPAPEPSPEPEASSEPEAPAEPEAASASPRIETWEALAKCESGNDWTIDTGNGYYGGLQFDHRSWHWAGGDRYSEYPHHASKAQQIEIAERLLEIHPAGWGAWPACTAQLGIS